MAQLNLHHLRLFRAIAGDGTLTGAARGLNLSQSALSTQLRTLEAVSYTHLDVYKRQGLHLIRALRAMVDGQTEETGEAEGFNRAILCFQRTPQHFGADVDAQRRLQRGAARMLNRAREKGRKLALMRAFGGVLQDGIQRLIGGGGDL